MLSCRYHVDVECKYYCNFKWKIVWRVIVQATCMIRSQRLDKQSSWSSHTRTRIMIQIQFAVISLRDEIHLIEIKRMFMSFCVEFVCAHLLTKNRVSSFRRERKVISSFCKFTTHFPTKSRRSTLNYWIHKRNNLLLQHMRENIFIFHVSPSTSALFAFSLSFVWSVTPFNGELVLSCSQHSPILTVRILPRAWRYTL